MWVKQRLWLKLHNEVCKNKSKLSLLKKQQQRMTNRTLFVYYRCMVQPFLFTMKQLYYLALQIQIKTFYW